MFSRFSVKTHKTYNDVVLVVLLDFISPLHARAYDKQRRPAIYARSRFIVPQIFKLIIPLGGLGLNTLAYVCLVKSWTSQQL